MVRAALLNQTMHAKAVLISSDGGGTEQPPFSSVWIVGRVWKSSQNGMVYNPDGISPCLCVGNHSGVEPKIIVYE